MAYAAVYTLVAILVLAIGLEYLIHVKPESGEPTYIPPRIPLLGHLIGIFVQKQQYFVNLRKSHPSFPIYGLSVFGSRIYIVNSPELVVAVQRNARDLSFVAYAANLADSVFKLSPSGIDILQKDVRGDKGVTGFAHDYIGVTHSALAFGPRLNELNQSLVQCITTIADELARKSSIETDLSKWITRELIRASTNAVYGPENPLADDISIDSYLDFERGLTGLLFLPRFIARKADQGRQNTVKLLTKYFRDEGYLKGSQYLQSRRASGLKYNMSIEDIARMELGGLTALTATSTPSAFWFICYIYSRPELLQSLREELEPTITNEASSTGKHYVMDVTKIKEQCPLFVSTFQEVIRHVSFGSTTRLVLNDAVINDRYLLKKDAVVMIPAASLHTDRAVFGPTADQFDPFRFVAKSKETKQKIPQGGLRIFGGGTSLCPGRHFAATEVFAFIGFLVLGYDVEPLTRDGNWKIPQPNTNNMAAAVPPAKSDIRVKIIQRKHWDGTWKMISSPPTMSFDPVTVP